MAGLLSDEMNEKLLCSQCSKYLSVPPVKVYANGLIKCGRCCGYNDRGAISVYTSIMQNFLFKCVNRYEGCKKFLKTSEVSDHEISCTGGNYECLECHSFSGTGYEIVQHFKKAHASRVVTNDQVNICVPKTDLEYSFYKKFLLVKDDVMYIILIRLAASKLEFSIVLFKFYPNINVSYNCVAVVDSLVTKTKKWNEIKCVTMGQYYPEFCTIEDNFEASTCITLFIQLNVHTLYTIGSISSYADNVDMKTDSIAIVSENVLNCEKEENLLEMPVVLTSDFKKKFAGYALSPDGTKLIRAEETIELLCSKCEIGMGINVFQCVEFQHLLCKDCNNYCSFCKRILNNLKPYTTNTNLLSILLFRCKWPNCTEYVIGYKKLEHESSCEKALLTCPTCFLIFTLPSIKLHIFQVHKGYFVDVPMHFIDFNNWIEKYGKRTAIYFIKNCHIFQISFDGNEVFLKYSSQINPKEDYSFYFCLNGDFSMRKKLYDGLFNRFQIGSNNLLYIIGMIWKTS